MVFGSAQSGAVAGSDNAVGETLMSPTPWLPQEQSRLLLLKQSCLRSTFIPSLMSISSYRVFPLALSKVYKIFSTILFLFFSLFFPK